MDNNKDLTSAEALTAQASFYRDKTNIIPARTDFSLSPAEHYSQFTLEELNADAGNANLNAPDTTEEFQRWARQKEAQSRVSFRSENTPAEASPIKDVTINTGKKKKTSKTVEVEEPVKHKSGWLLLNIGFWSMVIGATSMLMPSLCFLFLTVSYICSFKVLFGKNYGTFWTHIWSVLLILSTTIAAVMATVFTVIVANVQ